MSICLRARVALQTIFAIEPFEPCLYTSSKQVLRLLQDGPCDMHVRNALCTLQAVSLSLSLLLLFLQTCFQQTTSGCSPILSALWFAVIHKCRVPVYVKTRTVSFSADCKFPVPSPAPESRRSRAVSRPSENLKSPSPPAPSPSYITAL